MLDTETRHRDHFVRRHSSPNSRSNRLVVRIAGPLMAEDAALIILFDGGCAIR
jgi:hypothetical protein